MNFFVLALRKAWRFLFFLNGVITFIPLFPIFYVLISNEKWFPGVFFMKQIWGRLLTYNVGLRHRIIRKPVLKKNQPYIICPNHTSFLDIILTYLVIPRYFHFMGKAELKKIPLFKVFFNRMNIVVDRGSIIASHRAFLRASRDLDKNISIAIFPEATIPDSAPRLGRIKNGAFKLAIEKQVPIIPIVYLDNWRLLPDGERKKTGGSPGLCRVYVHDPIETKGMTEQDLNTLKKKYLHLLESTLIEYGCISKAEEQIKK